MSEAPGRARGRAGLNPLPFLLRRDGEGFMTRHGDGPSRPMRNAAAFVWLVFIIFPLADAITGRGSTAHHVLAITGAVVFVVAYVWVISIMFRSDLARLRYGLVGLVLGVAALLTLVNSPNWAFMFTYASACLAVVAPGPRRFPAVFANSIAAAVCGAIGGGDGGSVVGYWASAIGVGLLMVLLSDLRDRNRELTEARAELALAAVAQERERFARDLHDLLGHSLSVIAIKAELARRLLPDRPEDAAAEVADVEAVARKALREVRDAVSGYRRPTLDGELEGARIALTAAGMEAVLERTHVTLHPEVEAVLAWAVREGATNVIRHSGARHCHVTVTAGLDGAGVEVLDDGHGGHDAGDGGTRVGGNGLAGLTERAQRLDGRIEAGPRPGGHGFRLAVSVPLVPPDGGEDVASAVADGGQRAEAEARR